MWKWGWKMLLLVIAGVIVFLWLVKAPLMGSYLSNRLKVPVSVSKMSVWPSQTLIDDFRINNPRGFKTKTAFEAANTLIDYRFKNLFSNPSEIDSVILKDIFLSVEFSNPLGTQNNWTAIASQIPARDEKQSGRNVVIHRLILQNLTVQIRGLGLAFSPKITQIGQIELREINSENGFPTKELISAIFSQAGIQQYIKDAFNPQKAIQRYLNPFGFFWDASSNQVITAK